MKSVLSTIVLLASAVPAAAEELHWDAAALFERSVTEHLVLTEQGTSLELQRGVLCEDDGPAAGYSYQPNVERLSESVWIRKTLVVPHPEAAAGALLIGGRGTPMIHVNGKALDTDHPQKVGNYWTAHAVPPEWLREGENEFVLSGDGQIWIARAEDFPLGSTERIEHPGRSARSSDGGRTWDDRRLGPEGEIDGEYYVRLFLDQHQPRGMLTTPVIDAGNLGGRVVAPPLAALGPVRVALDGEPGGPGQLRAWLRSGSTFAADDKTWGEWKPLELPQSEPQSQELSGRFVQVRIELTTDDARRSPRLRALRVTAEPKVAADWTDSLMLIEQENPPIVRTSIPFRYEPFDHPRLAELRRRYELDEAVDGAETEFELITRLAKWSAVRFERGHLGKAYPPWDALEILQPHEDGTPVGGFCQQYNVVFLQACESFGLLGRAVSLGPHNALDRFRSGHEVVEIFSNEYRKWVYVDGQFAWYARDEKTGVPLSLRELRSRQLKAIDGKAFPAVRFVNLLPERHRWESLADKPPFLELRLIPRSDFLSRRAPLPLNQGMRGWFWTGHYVWTDGALPARPLYGHRIEKAANWDWTPNGTRIVLEATSTPGQLRVHLDTETPHFEAFTAKLADDSPKPVESGFLWRLEPGRNRLTVQSQNTAGRPGPPNSVTLDYAAR